MGIVNLLPHDHIMARTQKRVFRACLMLCPVMMAGIAVAALVSKNTCHRTMGVLQQTIRANEEALELLGRLQRSEARRSAVLGQAEGSAALLDKAPRSHVLAIVTNCLPEHTSLTRFELDAASRTAQGPSAAGPHGKVAARGDQMRVAGLATSNEAIGTYVSNLSRKSLFATVDLLFNQEKANDKGVREFQVLLELKPGADVLELMNQPGQDPKAASLSGRTMEDSQR